MWDVTLRARILELRVELFRGDIFDGPRAEACWLALGRSFQCLDIYFPDTTFQLSSTIFRKTFRNFSWKATMTFSLAVELGEACARVTLRHRAG